MAASASFLAFGGVALRTALQGAVSCGCFGQVAVNPWLVFGFDVAVVSLLLLARPCLKTIWKDGDDLRHWLARPAVLAVAVLLLVGVAGGLASGSARGILARLRGEAVGLDRETYDAGRQAPGGVVTYQLSVTNWSGESVRVYGGSSDCSRRVASPLPLTIGPGISEVVAVQLRLPEASGVVRERFYLLTDHPDARRIVCTLTCRCAAPD